MCNPTHAHAHRQGCCAVKTCNAALAWLWVWKGEKKEQQDKADLDFQLADSALCSPGSSLFLFLLAACPEDLVQQLSQVFPQQCALHSGVEVLQVNKVLLLLHTKIRQHSIAVGSILHGMAMHNKT